MAESIVIGADERLAEFNTELLALCARLGFNIGAEAYVLDGEIKVRVVASDARGVAEKTDGGGAI